MTTIKKKAGGGEARPATKQNTSQTNNIPDAPPAQDKAFVVFLHNIGVASFAETQGKFAKNPQWRSA